jgi:hypothetical protein
MEGEGTWRALPGLTTRKAATRAGLSARCAWLSGAGGRIINEAKQRRETHPMPNLPKKPAKAGHKLGANKHDPARATKPPTGNAKQSRDIREDRGTRQHKYAPAFRRTGARSR